ncbi:MAG: VOC family protein [Methylobacter sp.]
MAAKIFVNLPVKNINKSVEFFTYLGFTFDSQFTDETATCMVVTENIFVMLLTEAKFKTFTPKAICDATSCTEVLVCLTAESREKSMNWWVKLSPQVALSITIRKTMALCMDMDFRIWMATFGKSSSWKPVQ